MKEELIKYVMQKANNCYADDFPISRIEDWIRKFFDHYQPKVVSKDISECNICGHLLEPDGSCAMCPHIDETCGCC